MWQITSIRMLNSDSNRPAFDQSAQGNTLVTSVAFEDTDFPREARLPISAKPCISEAAKRSVFGVYLTTKSSWW